LIRPKKLDQRFSFLLITVSYWSELCGHAAQNSEDSNSSRGTAVRHRRHNGIYNNWK